MKRWLPLRKSMRYADPAETLEGGVLGAWFGML